MAVKNSFPTGNPTGLPISDTRNIVSNMFFSEASGAARSGIIPPSSSLLEIVAGASNMAYRVGAFMAVTSRATHLAEMVVNDSPVTVSTTAAPASNARYDVVYVRSRFSSLGDGNDLPEVGVVQGATAPVASLVKPPIPAGALELGTAIVRAGATATNQSSVTIANTSRFTTFAGGTLFVRTEAELADISAIWGSRAWTLNTRRDWIYQGSWRRAFPEPERITVSPAVLTGGSPPADAIFRRVEGIFTSSRTNEQGDCGITYPTEFTGGVVSAQVARYDPGVYGATSHTLHTTQTLSQLNLRVYAADGKPVPSAAGIRWSVTVCGWDRAVSA